MKTSRHRKVKQPAQVHSVSGRDSAHIPGVLMQDHTLTFHATLPLSRGFWGGARASSLVLPGFAHRGLDGSVIMVMRSVARTHHEVVELRGPGHELGPAHGHTDFHEAGVLAGLRLPHLTHDPAGRRGQTPWVTGQSQDSQP